ncbi:CC0125/CC1285 family lipoprotein [Acinetobacter rudis]|uniref:DUF4136 domain-containing protein n=1 Tax=Acinetobacter rudis TaxID=632955 RepID=A0AAW8JCU3_9GAMM|nr:hypothetical protein [Acinetobacter rudis]MDQ8937019.1 hypothetical protein [Acinetobacter rudis]MDQ8952513.1 hypothetical protein [Acinetobacter rudis]MDQ9019220.1 hypothetical protein [Acinetobacter rudis]
MKKIYIGLLLVAMGSLSACSTLPSKPLRFDQLGHFEAYQLSTQIYRVSFKTDRSLSYGTAEEIALLKSAQTTVKNGFAFFKVLDDPSNRNQKAPRQAVVYPAPTYNPYPYGYYRGRHAPFYDPFFYNQPQIVQIDPTEVSYSIECFKNKASAPNDAFEARLILQSLGPKYGVGPTGDVLPVEAPQTKAK